MLATVAVTARDTPVASRAAIAIRMNRPASSGPGRWPARTRRWSAARESKIMNMPARVARAVMATGAEGEINHLAHLAAVLVQGQANPAAGGQRGGEHNEHRRHGGQQHPQHPVAA